MLHQPLRVVTRASTDVLAVEEPRVAAALRIMMDRGPGPLKVRDILEELPVSRRALEHAFRRSLGRTPGEELLRLRIRHAERLLTTCDRALPWIAKRAGFSSRQHMDTVFHKFHGMSASQFRNRASL